LKTTRHVEAKLTDPQRPYLKRDLCERIVRHATQHRGAAGWAHPPLGMGA